jgi:hypothetical protein
VLAAAPKVDGAVAAEGEGDKRDEAAAAVAVAVAVAAAAVLTPLVVDLLALSRTLT